ncbi:hypothetical protein ACMGD3_00655 [Lysinibacillus sphaericus]|uniref:hypothetical protein n=1 Tax=Lysinibacillus sphaericus TaxID=1421 RepID=UPI003F78E2F6
MKMIRSFFCLLATLVLSVLYGGLILSAVLLILAGILRTVGYDQLKMSIWQGVDLPIVLSIPLSLVVSFLLFIASLYVKRSLVFCYSQLKF